MPELSEEMKEEKKTEGKEVKKEEKPEEKKEPIQGEKKELIQGEKKEPSHDEKKEQGKQEQPSLGKKKEPAKEEEKSAKQQADSKQKGGEEKKEEPKLEDLVMKDRSKSEIARNEELEKKKIEREDENHIMMDIELSLQEITLCAINKKTNLGEFELSVKQASVKFIGKPKETQVNLELNNIQLFDLSNYPHTLIKEDDYSKIQKREIIGIDKKKSSLLKLDFKSYDPSNPLVKDHTTSFFNLELQSISVDFIFQVIFIFMKCQLN